MAKQTKPDKPYPEFPLTAHPAGVWAKKIRGKLYYFGPWSEPDAALAKYLRERDFRQAGQEPPAEGETRLTMEELCNQFLESMDGRVQIGKMSRRQHRDYQKECLRLAEIVGRSKIVEALRPTDFDGYAVKLAKGVGLVTFMGRVRRARTVFRFAAEQELIPKPLKFGKSFKIPTKSELRIAASNAPSRDYKAEEIRLFIDNATMPLKAMILLGINCGFGPTDCATLPRRCIDLGNSWIDFSRPKTGIERECPLWPETVAAIKSAIAIRPEPKDPEHDELVFLTRFGVPYVRLTEKGDHLDFIGSEFGKLMRTLKLAGNGRGFYSFRRTFQTIGDESRDEVCVKHIMGHGPASDDMSATYRQHVSKTNLKAVADYVRKWLWPKKRKAAGKQA